MLSPLFISPAVEEEQEEEEEEKGSWIPLSGPNFAHFCNANNRNSTLLPPLLLLLLLLLLLPLLLPPAGVVVLGRELAIPFQKLLPCGEEEEEVKEEKEIVIQILN